MTSRDYKPVRTRGVYRAAANKSSPIHEWATKLIKAREEGGLPGLFKWVYRDSGKFSFADMVYNQMDFWRRDK